MRSFEIPHLWTTAVKKETRALVQEVSAEDAIGRFDLRNHQFVTIDGEDAKDFDDAVYAERTGHGGWTLYVAIADVSHYVKPGSALDAEASNRGTSVYFPGHVGSDAARKAVEWAVFPEAANRPTGYGQRNAYLCRRGIGGLSVL